MVQFDGENKLIVLSVNTSFNLIDIYSLARKWESQTGTMIFHNPFNASEELLFTLRFGWKFRPHNYPINTTVRVNGKINTTEGDNVVKTVPPTLGQPVTWQFDTPATAVMVTTGSGVTPQDKIDIKEAVRIEMDTKSEIARDARQAKMNTY